MELLVSLKRQNYLKPLTEQRGHSCDNEAATQ